MTPTYQDEWLLDAPLMREFIEHVNDVRLRGRDPQDAVNQIRPHFLTLLNDATWLPPHFQEPAQGESGMGSRIGMWLLYRSGDGGLAFSALVLPPGASTPVHDHLAWGLVGVYRGEQSEDVYAREDDGRHAHQADLKHIQHNVLKRGDYYELNNEIDIHKVTTISDATSVSLHLLGNDNGCIWRHRYQPELHQVEPFKSGWLNVECREYESA